MLWVIRRVCTIKWMWSRKEDWKIKFTIAITVVEMSERQSLKVTWFLIGWNLSRSIMHWVHLTYTWVQTIVFVYRISYNLHLHMSYAYYIWTLIFVSLSFIIIFLYEKVITLHLTFLGKFNRKTKFLYTYYWLDVVSEFVS